MRTQNKKMDRYFELSESGTFKMVCPFPVAIECPQRAHSIVVNGFPKRMECAGRSADDFPVFVGVV